MPLIGKHVEYVAAPKTGSSWTRRVLMDVGEELKSGDGDRHIVSDAGTRGKPVLTTIRHPKTWVVSAYRWKHFHRGERVRKEFPGPAGILNHFPTEFDEWVEELTGRKGIVGEIFESYTDVADHVIRQEYLREGLAAVLGPLVGFDKAGAAVARGRENETTRAPDYHLSAEQEEALTASESEFISKWY